MDNTCQKCGKPGVIVEASADGKTKIKKCLHCGNQLVEDVQGRKLLTEVVPAASPRQLLIEG